jgi:hypothetical protein
MTTNESLNEKLLKTECSICLSEIKKGQNISIPACECKEILYHTSCYYKWINTNPSCPQCRTDIQIVLEDITDEDLDPMNYIDPREQIMESNNSDDGDDEESIDSDEEEQYNMEVNSISENHYNATPNVYPHNVRILGRNLANRSTIVNINRRERRGLQKKGCTACFNLGLMCVFFYWLYNFSMY